MPPPFPLGVALVVGAILAWDIVVASRGAQAPAAAPALRALTALTGILLAPGLLVAVADGALLTARLTQQLWWLWPATVACATLQAAWVALRRPVAPAVALPLAAWNGLLLVAAAARVLPERGMDEPAWMGAVAAAVLHACAAVAGPAALTSPFMVLPPVLAPSLPSRWRPVAVVRAGVSAVAALASALVLSRLPGAVEARRSYARYAVERLQERPSGDIAIGLRILPRIDRAPSPYALRGDLALADSVQPRALLVRVAAATPLAALDSLARALEPLRRDSVQLVLEAAEGSARVDPRVLERLARRLRPEFVVIEAEPPARRGARGSDPLVRLEEAGRGVHAGYAGARVVVAIDPLMSDARAWFTWARTRAAGVAVAGVVLRAGTGGAAELDEQLAMVSQWIASQPSDRPVWVTRLATAPAAHGEEAQALAWRGLLAWAMRTPDVRGVLAGPASDYADVTGVRAASGRLRPVARVLAATAHGLREGRAATRASPP
ncbi:MAG: hypothetical protein HYX65_10175 [Gemmatimonadetes bacterium]|nr:hypothetical protein [Gemmatimonadota bacterium]